MFARIIVLALATTLVEALPSLVAQDPLLGPTLTHVQEVRQKIPTWRREANLYAAISWMVFGLGLVTAGAQVFQLSGTKAEDTAAAPRPKKSSQIRQAVRVGVLATGLAVSGLTGVLDRGFPCDHRAYRKAILQAETVLRNIENQAELFKSDPDLHDEQLTAKARHKAKLDFLNKNVDPPMQQLRDVEERLVSWVPLRNPGVVYAADVRGTSATGLGESSSLFQAQENSVSSAVEAMATKLAESAKVVLNSANRDILRAYVSRYSSRSQQPVNTKGAAPGVFCHQTTLTMEPGYTSAYAVKTHLASETKGLTVEEEIQKIRVAAAQGKLGPDRDGFIEAVVRIPAEGKPLRQKVQLRSANPVNGSFVFEIAVGSANGEAATVSVESIQIEQDGSSGTTRWAFEILNQGRRIITLAEQRWDDSRTATRCNYSGQAAYTGTARVVNGQVELTLVGLKPKLRL